MRGRHENGQHVDGRGVGGNHVRIAAQRCVGGRPAIDTDRATRCDGADARATGGHARHARQRQLPGDERRGRLVAGSCRVSAGTARQAGRDEVGALYLWKRRLLQRWRERPPSPVRDRVSRISGDRTRATAQRSRGHCAAARDTAAASCTRRSHAAGTRHDGCRVGVRTGLGPEAERRPEQPVSPQDRPQGGCSLRLQLWGGCRLWRSRRIRESKRWSS